MKYLTSLVFAAFLLLLLAAAPLDDTDLVVAQLASDVNELDERVNSLEHALGGGSGETGGFTLEVGSGRTMVVDAIQTSEHVDDNSAKVERLQREVDSLEQTVNSERDKLAQISGRYSGTSSGSYGGRSASSDRNRRLASQQRMISSYSSQLSVKRRELDKLNRAADQQKQIIHGHDGDVVLLMTTANDLGRELSTVTLGDSITWNGRRLEATRESETWTVSSISRVDPQDSE